MLTLAVARDKAKSVTGAFQMSQEAKGALSALAATSCLL